MVTMWLPLGICALFCGCLGENVLVPRVTIPQGVVVGSVGANNKYFEFHGIPYADSTSGINRFKAPSAPPTFRDEFTANRKNIKCVRALGGGYEGTEDCLVVNVHTPTLDTDSQLPVIVWIKGKELDKENELEISFDRFLEKEVVVVEINYRESILGFLCLGTERAPGNAGLKDIIAGLRWIQESIAAFGGDPNNVSILGHGSGAAAVDLITLSKAAHGLVHKAIAQSGSAFSPWAVTRDNLRYAVDVAKALGHTVEDLETLSTIFTRTSVAALMAVINELELTDNSLAFAPCIEREIDDVEPLLLKSPYATIMEREHLEIPFITGFVDLEGTIRAEEAIHNDWLERMDESFVDFLQPDIDFLSEEQANLIAEEIKTFYFETGEINENKVNDFLLYNGDTMILVSAIREARMRAVSSTSPVYLYQFSYRGQLSEALDRPLQIDSAGHKEELVYMFHSNDNYEASVLDLVVGDILIERWTNFAKTGIPSSDTSHVTWNPYTFNNSYYLRILDDQEINVSGNSDLDEQLENPHPATLRFWDNIYTDYFLDATSRWTLESKDIEDDSDIEDNDDIAEGDGDDNGDDTEEGDGEGSGDDDVEDRPDSATTTVGYTFAILTLFAILDKFHSTQILS